MTVPTPKQMRALAGALDAGVSRNEGLYPDEAQNVEYSIIALRAAADQLEAVRVWNRTDERTHVLDRDWLDAILDGDTEAIEATANTGLHGDRPGTHGIRGV